MSISGASILILSIDPISRTLLKAFKNSLELSGNVAASSRSQPTIIISAPDDSAKEFAIEVKTILRPGTQTLLAVSLEISLSSKSLTLGSGTSAVDVKADSPSSESHGSSITVCSAPISLHTALADLISISALFCP